MRRISFFIILLVSIILVACSGQKEEKATRVHPDWCLDATIYELNLRQFTPEGTFAAAEEHLPRIKDLGVDIVWLMPIQRIGELERKGTLGSYYAIADYKEVNPEFGTLDDVKGFVAKAHELGLYVILDWVANHTSPDAVWSINRDWYVQDEDGDLVAPYDWSDVAKLNYDNEDMRNAMVQAMLYWLKEAKLDGFRCDVASEVPTDFWNDAVNRLMTYNPNIFMLAEAEAPDLMEHAFDAYYGWDFHHIMNDIAQGNKNAEQLRLFFREHDKKFKTGISMNFTSNHDENSWNGTEFERMGDAAETFAALTYVVPGMPLIYNGQEIGFDRRLEFFEKDSIDWVAANEFTNLYKSLNRLRKDNKALHSGLYNMDYLVTNHPEEVFSIIRREGDNTVVALFNLSDKELEATFDFKDNQGNYKEFRAEESKTLSNSEALVFAPWEYKIFIKNS